MNSQDIDRIMRLAYEMADAKAAHRVTSLAFANNQSDAEWEDIVALTDAWRRAQKALRTALEDVQHFGVVMVDPE